MNDVTKLADDLLRGEAEASATLSDKEVAQSREREPEKSEQVDDKPIFDEPSGRMVKKCPECKGRGEVLWGGTYDTCPKCSGSGWVDAGPVPSEGRKEIEDTIKKIAAKRKKEKAPEMGEQFTDGGQVEQLDVIIKFRSDQGVPVVEEVLVNGQLVDAQDVPAVVGGGQAWTLFGTESGAIDLVESSW